MPNGWISKSWYEQNWKSLESRVSTIQFKIARAHIRGNSQLCTKLQLDLINSKAAAFIAVKRVTSNRGKKTPGIDGVLWTTPNERLAAVWAVSEVVKDIDNYKARPLLRVLIPKENSDEKRPLGIPTIIDRAIQAIYTLAIDPVVECQSDERSHGFRRFRSCDTAISNIRHVLQNKSSDEYYILDADIAKCFDSISHAAILRLAIVPNKHPIKEWLKAPIAIKKNKNDKGYTIEPNTKGTPQGGVISPMLCNIVLNGMEKVVYTYNRDPVGRRYDGRKTIQYLIRYADDFVVLSRNYQDLVNVKRLIEQFLSTWGLELSEGKTNIVHVHDGFNFLGWHIQRKKATRDNKTKPLPKMPNSVEERVRHQTKSVLIIRPMPAKVKSLKRRLKETVYSDKNQSFAELITRSNQQIMGWCNYYNSSYHSQPVFIELGDWQYWRVLSWLRKKFKISAEKAIGRYCTKNKDESKLNVTKGQYRSWVWRTLVPAADGRKRRMYKLYDPGITLQRKVVPHRHGMNPYTDEGRRYWQNRKPLYSPLNDFRRKVYEKTDGKCWICGESLWEYCDNTEVSLSGFGERHMEVDIHRENPGRKDGKYTLDNCWPVHRHCHPSADSVTSKMRDENLELDDDPTSA